jgi:hypothetical protein
MQKNLSVLFFLSFFLVGGSTLHFKIIFPKHDLPLWRLRIGSEWVVELLVLTFVVGYNFSCQLQGGFTWPILRGWQAMVDCDEREERNVQNYFSHFFENYFVSPLDLLFANLEFRLTKKIMRKVHLYQRESQKRVRK